MSTLTEFLLARINEDEDAAKAADQGTVYAAGAYGDDAVGELLELARNEGALGEAVKHLERYTVARVLAECDAKRKLIALIDREWDTLIELDVMPDWAGDRRDAWEQMICLLATPYADHPDYDLSWAPD